MFHDVLRSEDIEQKRKKEKEAKNMTKNNAISPYIKQLIH